GEKRRGGQEAAEPCRRGNQMQPIGRAMEGAEPTGRRRGVTGMDQCRGERAGKQRRHRPARQIEVLWGDPTQGCGKQRRQHEPREPIMSEGGVEEHRPHNTADESFAWRALADVRGEHHQPRHARDQRGGGSRPWSRSEQATKNFTVSFTKRWRTWLRCVCRSRARTIWCSYLLPGYRGSLLHSAATA